jgi:hypothetical protein
MPIEDCQLTFLHLPMVQPELCPLDESFILDSESRPLFVQDGKVVQAYVEAFEKVPANLGGRGGGAALTSPNDQQLGALVTERLQTDVSACARAKPPGGEFIRTRPVPVRAVAKFRAPGCVPQRSLRGSAGSGGRFRRPTARRARDAPLPQSQTRQVRLLLFPADGRAAVGDRDAEYERGIRPSRSPGGHRGLCRRPRPRSG